MYNFKSSSVSPSQVCTLMFVKVNGTSNAEDAVGKSVATEEVYAYSDQ